MLAIIRQCVCAKSYIHTHRQGIKKTEENSPQAARKSKNVPRKDIVTKHYDKNTLRHTQELEALPHEWSRNENSPQCDQENVRYYIIATYTRTNWVETRSKVVLKVKCSRGGAWEKTGPPLVNVFPSSTCILLANPRDLADQPRGNEFCYENDADTSWR